MAIGGSGTSANTGVSTNEADLRLIMNGGENFVARITAMQTQIAELQSTMRDYNVAKPTIDALQAAQAEEQKARELHEQAQRMRDEAEQAASAMINQAHAQASDILSDANAARAAILDEAAALRDKAAADRTQAANSIIEARQQIEEAIADAQAKANAGVDAMLKAKAAQADAVVAKAANDAFNAQLLDAHMQISKIITNIGVK